MKCSCNTRAAVREQKKHLSPPVHIHHAPAALLHAGAEAIGRSCSAKKRSKPQYCGNTEEGEHVETSTWSGQSDRDATCGSTWGVGLAGIAGCTRLHSPMRFSRLSCTNCMATEGSSTSSNATCEARNIGRERKKVMSATF